MARWAAETRTTEAGRPNHHPSPQGLVISSCQLASSTEARLERSEGCTGGEDVGTSVGRSLEKSGYQDEVRRRVVTGGALGAEEGYFKLEET